MNIEITRSYSRKIQVKEYEPVEFFCSAKMEVDEKDADATSARLTQFVQNEVQKDVSNLEPVCRFCKGKTVWPSDSDPIVNGYHKKCRERLDWQVKENTKGDSKLKTLIDQ